MKKGNITQQSFGVGIVLLFAFVSLTDPIVLHAEDKPRAAAAPSQLAKDLIGTWVAVGRPGAVARLLRQAAVSSSTREGTGP